MDILAPDIGTRFTYQERDYVVKGYLRRMAPPEPPAEERDPFQDMLATILYESQQECGPDRCRLMFCDRLEADYVSGGGCIARIADIAITGAIDWSPDRIAYERQRSARLAGHPLF